MATVLCIEDYDNQRIFYEQELSLEGYDVITATDGQEALKKVKEYQPDIIIMDINMPNMNGLETMGRIFSKHKGIPIIIHTAYSNYKNNFVSWAADGYIIKSSDLTELKSKKKSCLQIKRKIQWQ